MSEAWDVIRKTEDHRPFITEEDFELLSDAQRAELAWDCKHDPLENVIWLRSIFAQLSLRRPEFPTAPTCGD